MFGLGLLEAVPDLAILAMADPRDRNHDGVSGKPNLVWDQARRRTVLGRFGWKANAPNLVQQTAGAYNGDMGVTSSLFSAESCEGQDPRCGAHAPEVDDQTVADVALYTRTLGVPARRESRRREGLRGRAVVPCRGLRGLPRGDAAHRPAPRGA